MDALETLQARVTGYLLRVAALQSTPVFLMRPRLDASGNAITAPQLQQAVSDALGGITLRGGKAGTAISVLMPEEGVIDHMQVGESNATEVRLTLRILENLMVNTTPGLGTFLSCETLCNEVMANLHGLLLGDIVLRSDEARGKYPVNVKDDDTLLVYEMLFTGIAKRPAATRVSEIKAILSAAPLPRNVTLGCATEDAAIWVTTDGSFPAPDNANATQYTTTFSITDPCTLSAVAFKDGLSPSNLLQRILT